MPASEVHQFDDTRKALAQLYRATGDREREKQWSRGDATSGTTCEGSPIGPIGPDELTPVNAAKRLGLGARSGLGGVPA
jgi:hypothetical protein